MDKIMQKLQAQQRKVAKMKERDQNKLCTMCRRPMKVGGFSSIPGVCKQCENEAVHGDDAHPEY